MPSIIKIEGIFQYSGRDLNPHERNVHWILSPACLPIPPPEHPYIVKSYKDFICTRWFCGCKYKLVFRSYKPFSIIFTNYFMVHSDSSLL